MNSNRETNEQIKRAFSSYAKSCLKHAKKDYVDKVSRDSANVLSLDAVNFEININFIQDYRSVHQFTDDLSFTQTLHQLPLSEKEKMIIYLKYYEDKTDKYISKLLGISRQAVTKTRTDILVKLKREMEP